MPSSNIKVNGIAASNDDLPINVLVSLDNMNTGGELNFLWSIVDQPPGPADALSSAVIQSPTFTPKKEGTYLLQLIVNAGPGQLVDRKIVGVRQLKSRERVPAAQEDTQDGARGWAGASGSFLQRLDGLAADPGVHVGVAGAVGLMAGTVVRASGETVIKAGLPGQETLASYTQALATVSTNVDGPLFVLLGGVDGNPAPASGALVRARLLGPVFGATGAPSVDDPVFVSDAGSPSLVAGTISRKIGKVLATGGGLYDFWMDGTFAPLDLFLLQDDQQAGADATASAVFVDAAGLPSLVATIPGTRMYLLHVDLSCFMLGASDSVFFRVLVDGVAIPGQPTFAAHFFFNNLSQHLRISWRIAAPLTAGAHTIKLQWHTTGAGTVTVAADDFREFVLQG